MNPMEKPHRERNPKPENISYLVDNKTFLYYHGYFYQLTAIKGKYTPATMYQYLENIILQ